MMKVVPTRVGEAFQAEIPALLSPAEQRQRESKGVRPPCRAQWSPGQTQLSDDELTAFLERSRLNETETALRCLYEGGLDVRRASQLLHKDRHRRARAAAQQKAALSDDTFEAAVVAHGKRFSTIQQLYPTTSTAELVARFYLWKTTTAYKKWHERVKAKKNKETARLRQWADTEGESDTSDFHNEYCELCFTGGQLLCCDGCERAYHFSCVEPPIKDVPVGDWFCVACVAILGASAEQRTSHENEHCDEVVVLEPRSPKREKASSSSLRAARSDCGATDDDDDDVMNGDVATDWNETEGIEDTTMDDDRNGGDVVIKQEHPSTPARLYPHQRLYTPERPRQLLQAKRPVVYDSDTRTPTRSPLVLEVTNRKRQRKIVAPRRIPQPAIHSTNK